MGKRWAPPSSQPSEGPHVLNPVEISSGLNHPNDLLGEGFEILRIISCRDTPLRRRRAMASAASEDLRQQAGSPRSHERLRGGIDPLDIVHDP